MITKARASPAKAAKQRRLLHPHIDLDLELGPSSPVNKYRLVVLYIPFIVYDLRIAGAQYADGKLWSRNCCYKNCTQFPPRHPHKNKSLGAWNIWGSIDGGSSARSIMISNTVYQSIMRGLPETAA